MGEAVDAVRPGGGEVPARLAICRMDHAGADGEWRTGVRRMQ